MMRPEAKLKSEIVVECPCGDKSFKKEIHGQFCLGNIQDSGVVMSDTPTEVDTTDDGILLQKMVVKTKEVQ